jgi:aryl-alcohol dehydrogenase-like predicted oxidoreductase
MDYVDFGNTGLRVSRLAFGTGTNGWGGRSDQADLGVDRLAGLLRLGYDLGVNLWDGADAYGGNPHIARALRMVPRDDVVIATKTSSKSEEGVAQDIERFLRELGVGHLDIVLLHCMSGFDWPERYSGAAEALSRAKEQGKARAVGVSCHGVGALRAAAQCGWVDVVLARVDPAGVHMGAPRSEIVRALEQPFVSGKAIYGMKVLGCGRLADDPGSAMRYVLSLGTVHSIAIGMSSRQELTENVRLVEEVAPQHPLGGRSSGRKRAPTEERYAESSR